MEAKQLLILKAAKDVCVAEIDHIKAVAEMFAIKSCVKEFQDQDTFRDEVCNGGKYDYLYVAAHADLNGFGEADASIFIDWEEFAAILCVTKCLNPQSILLLGCCRGGLKRVARVLFQSCEQIDYVCGPRWTVTGQDISVGFHIFLYNMEVRNEQPSVAVHRASLGTGYDFFCHDRVEFDDEDF